MDSQEVTRLINRLQYVVDWKMSYAMLTPEETEFVLDCLISTRNIQQQMKDSEIFYGTITFPKTQFEKIKGSLSVYMWHNITIKSNGFYVMGFSYYADNLEKINNALKTVNHYGVLTGLTYDQMQSILDK